ncbi:hypothetical protein AVEN_159850-1 [Araneus ventricosus]|uniref:Uncharacterized protein n=1 Tax=Araneus ventricosus TaxID=182803 RepID=A0A4Y2HFR8_ARAVE|nr:hypothetical protein AVEN_159850-1 [Araneus ventricosus]
MKATESLTRGIAHIPTHPSQHPVSCFPWMGFPIVEADHLKGMHGQQQGVVEEQKMRARTVASPGNRAVAKFPRCNTSYTMPTFILCHTGAK